APRGSAALFRVGKPDRADQPGAGSGPPQLDEVRALAVPVARGAFGVDRDRAGATAQRRDGGTQLRGRGDGLRDAVTRLLQHRDVADGRAGTVRVGGRHERAGYSRGFLRTVTPSGGTPAALHSMSTNASRCGARSGVRAVQDPRSSSATDVRGPWTSPNRVDVVCVTVPPAAR